MKRVGFFIRHFTERGTEIATYDYAHYNETLLNNKSFIIHFTDTAQLNHQFPLIKYTYEKFKTRFELIEINDISDMKDVINKYQLNVFFTMTHGGPDIYQFNNNNIWQQCKTIKHCVFTTNCCESNHYLTLSQHLNYKFNTNYTVLPYIVNNLNITDNLRQTLNIPNNAIVLGRHGGFHQFDLGIAHDAIKLFLSQNHHVYFLFLNTKVFYEHPQIIYLEKNIDVIYKNQFINTCDAMIHARSDGETFGLAIAEFSIKNKPIITCPCGDLEHILILGNNVIKYNNINELLLIFTNISTILNAKKDWRGYKNYSPEIVMQQFNTIISSPNAVISSAPNAVISSAPNAVISSGDRKHIINYIKNKKIHDASYKVIDIGGSAGGWSHEVIDFIVDINAPPIQTHIQYFSLDINKEREWEQIEAYVQKHGKFDFSICSHTLEDISMPNVVVEQLFKISKEGYIAVPSKYREFCRFEGGNDYPYRGYIHHKWIMHMINNTLYAWPKLNLIESSIFDCIADINDNVKDLSFMWSDTFQFKIINDGYMGPNVNAVKDFYVNGLIHNCIL